MNQYQKEIKKFCDERDWNQFFDPKDLLLGIVEEVGELRNIVKWLKTREESTKALIDNKDEVKDAVETFPGFYLYWPIQPELILTRQLTGLLRIIKKDFRWKK